MGFMDGFTSDGTVDMKHTEYYNLMKEAAKAELLSNAVKAEAAVEWCHGQGLEFDAVNEPLPEQVARWGNDTRKVYADFYIDDKAMSVSELEAIMDKVVDIVGEYVNQ